MKNRCKDNYSDLQSNKSTFYFSVLFTIKCAFSCYGNRTGTGHERNSANYYQLMITVPKKKLFTIKVL